MAGLREMPRTFSDRPTWGRGMDCLTLRNSGRSLWTFFEAPGATRPDSAARGQVPQALEEEWWQKPLN